MRSLRRALDDLAEGLRALLGPEASRPELVRELLEGHRSRAPFRRARPPRRRASRAHGAAKPRLALVE
jgi:hypothetical protein